MPAQEISVSAPGSAGARVAEDFSALDRAVRISGAAINSIVLVAAATTFVTHITAAWHPSLLLILPAAFFVATFAADLVSGILHWAFDTWFSPDSRAFRRMVVIVRGHHLRPDDIFMFRFAADAGMLSWFGALGALAALLPARLFQAGSSLLCGISLAAIVFGLDVALMFEYHKWGHRRRRGRAARILQRSGLLLSPEHHMRHHRGAHDSHYCLINGIADRTLGSLGLFRFLERLVTALTGAVPRADDLATLRRVGRSDLDRTPGGAR